jgi:hypothetical protein
MSESAAPAPAGTENEPKRDRPPLVVRAYCRVRNRIKWIIGWSKHYLVRAWDLTAFAGRVIGNGVGALTAKTLRVPRVRKQVKTMYAIRPRVGVLRQHAPRPLAAPQPLDVRSNETTWPLISVVTPSWNQAGFIERTMKSVVDQGYPALEYIVRDGGSEDGTVDLLERYDDRLHKWVSAPDAGQADAINQGFAGASGEIMAWLNSDDLLMPGALHYVGRYFREHPEVDVVYGQRILIDESDREIGRWILPRHDDAVLPWADYVPQETMFWRRRAWERSGARLDPSFQFALDWDLILRFREAGAVFHRVPRFLGAFRIHEEQKTSSIIGDRGMMEMGWLRERVLGTVPTQSEIDYNVSGYLMRHLACHAAYRLGLRRYE